MAIPTIVSVGTAAASITDTTPAPGSHAADDWLFLLVETQAESVATPAGYAITKGSPIQNAAASVRLSIFQQKATSGAMGSPTVVDPGDHNVSLIIAVRGADLIDPVVAAAAYATIISTSSGQFPGLYNPVVDSLYLGALAWGLDSAGPIGSAEANSSLASVAEQHDAGSTLGGGGGLYVVSGTKAAIGNVDMTTMTLTSTPFSCLSLLIQPPVVAAAANTKLAYSKARYLSRRR